MHKNKSQCSVEKNKPDIIIFNGEISKATSIDESFFFLCHHSMEIKFTVHSSNSVFLYDLKDFANYFKNFGLLLECDPSTK